MSDDYFLEEFRPPDADMVDYILTTSRMVNNLAESQDTEDNRLLLESTSRSLKVLLAMAVAGYNLYKTEMTHGNILLEVSEGLYDRLVLTDNGQVRESDSLAINEYREWRTKMENFSIDDIMEEDEE
jgi:hypothetical protein